MTVSSGANYEGRVLKRGTVIEQKVTELSRFLIRKSSSLDFAEPKLLGYERIFNVRRAFTLRHGAKRSEDSLPQRLLKEPIPAGPSKGYVARLDEMLPQYYEMRGWNTASGVPLKEKLLELDLDDIAKEYVAASHWTRNND